MHPIQVMFPSICSEFMAMGLALGLICETGDGVFGNSNEDDVTPEEIFRARLLLLLGVQQQNGIGGQGAFIQQQPAVVVEGQQAQQQNGIGGQGAVVQQQPVVMVEGQQAQAIVNAQGSQTSAPPPLPAVTATLSAPSFDADDDEDDDALLNLNILRFDPAAPPHDAAPSAAQVLSMSDVSPLPPGGGPSSSDIAQHTPNGFLIPKSFDLDLLLRTAIERNGFFFAEFSGPTSRTVLWPCIRPMDTLGLSKLTLNHLKSGRMFRAYGDGRLSIQQTVPMNEFDNVLQGPFAVVQCGVGKFAWNVAPVQQIHRWDFIKHVVLSQSLSLFKKDSFYDFDRLVDTVEWMQGMLDEEQARKQTRFEQAEEEMKQAERVRQEMDAAADKRRQRQQQREQAQKAAATSTSQLSTSAESSSAMSSVRKIIELRAGDTIEYRHPIEKLDVTTRVKSITNGHLGPEGATYVLENDHQLEGRWHVIKGNDWNTWENFVLIDGEDKSITSFQERTLHFFDQARKDGMRILAGHADAALKAKVDELGQRRNDGKAARMEARAAGDDADLFPEIDSSSSSSDDDD